MARHLVFALLSLVLVAPLSADVADPAAGLDERLARLESAVASAEHRFDELAKQIDDLLWFERVGDVAVVDKVH
jgi:cell division protein FtsL